MIIKIKLNKILNMFLMLLFCYLLQNNLFAQLLPIFKSNNIGYIDSTGKIVIPCKYEAELDFIEYNVNGKSFVDFVLPMWSHFFNGSVTVKIPKKWLFFNNGYKYALVNDKGNYIFAPDDNFISGLSEGLVIYKRLFKTFEYAYDFKYGYVNMEGDIVINPQYRYASIFSDGAALVLDSIKYKFISKDGSNLFDIDFIDATLFQDGIAAVKLTKEDTVYTFIDKTGKVIFPEKFKYAYNFIENRARVYDGEYYGFIDKTGKYIVFPDYNKAEDFCEGLALVNKDSKYGFIDSNSKIVIPIDFKYAKSFSEGLAVVYLGCKFGFINKTGKLIIKNEFDYAKSFKFGLAQVWKNDEVYYINKKGEKIFTIFSKNKYRQICSKKIFKY